MAIPTQESLGHNNRLFDGVGEEKIKNILKYLKEKDKYLGMNSVKYDLIVYIIVILGSWLAGNPKVGIGIVMVVVLVDLVISYYRGRGMS